MSEYNCHQCQRNISKGREFFSLEVRAVDYTGADSVEQDSEWVLCSKKCVRQALPRIAALMQHSVKQ